LRCQSGGWSLDKIEAGGGAEQSRQPLAHIDQADTGTMWFASQAHAVVAYSQHELAILLAAGNFKADGTKLGLQTVADGVFNERLQQHRWDSQPPGTAISHVSRPPIRWAWMRRSTSSRRHSSPSDVSSARLCTRLARKYSFKRSSNVRADLTRPCVGKIEVRDSDCEEMNSEIEARSRGTTIYA
jgi:hypothetical protein